MKVRQTFMDNFPTNLKAGYVIPTVKAMWHKFRTLFFDRNNYVKIIEARCGALDKSSPAEDFLDDFIQASEDIKSRKRKLN